MTLKRRSIAVLLLRVVIAKLLARLNVFPSKQTDSRQALAADEHTLHNEVRVATVIDVARDVSTDPPIDQKFRATLVQAGRVSIRHTVKVIISRCRRDDSAVKEVFVVFAFFGVFDSKDLANILRNVVASIDFVPAAHTPTFFAGFENFEVAWQSWCTIN